MFCLIFVKGARKYSISDSIDCKQNIFLPASTVFVYIIEEMPLFFWGDKQQFLLCGQ